MVSMSKIFLVNLFLLMAMAPLANAGNDLKTGNSGYKRIATQDPTKVVGSAKRPKKIAALKEARDKIWQDSCITKEERKQKILLVYFYGLWELKTTRDYIDLLSNTSHLAPTTDDFIYDELEHFFFTRPNFEQLKAFDSILSQTATMLALKERALQLVKKPADFLELVTIDAKAPQEYKEGVTNFIKDNIGIFKLIKPDIEDIYVLQNYILSIQVNGESTVDALIALKRVFISEFVQEDLLMLLFYGCENPRKEYVKKLDLLKQEFPFLDDNMPKCTTKAAMESARDGIWNKTRLSKDDRYSIIAQIYTRALPLMNTAEDYLDLFSDTNLRKAANLFLVHNLESFLATKPNFKQMIKMLTMNVYEKATRIIRREELSLLKSSDDFLEIVRTDEKKNFTVKYKNDTTKFIKDNLTKFASTQPSIDQIMELQKLIFDYQADAEKTIAALIELKQMFITKFSGTDLIRLLDLGCDAPMASYERQLNALKKMNNIEF